jgi:hypothetical protein
MIATAETGPMTTAAITMTLTATSLPAANNEPLIVSAGASRRSRGVTLAAAATTPPDVPPQGTQEIERGCAAESCEGAYRVSTSHPIVHTRARVEAATVGASPASGRLSGYGPG